MKYKCEYLGDFNTPNGSVFSIYSQIPIIYNSYKEAEKCSVFLRFKKIDGHIVLFMYKNEEDKSDDQCKVIDIIKWDEWWKYRVVEMKKESYNNASIENEDFLPNGTNWNELFGVNNLNDDWFETVIGIENIINPILNNNDVLIKDVRMLECLEKELYNISAINEFYRGSWYWNKRNFILGKMESLFYKILIHGKQEEKLKAINKICELYFTLNVNLYKRYIIRYEEIFKSFNHMSYLPSPISIKELKYKNKKIIIEYYLLGEKIYTDNKHFLYGVLYFSSDLISCNTLYGYYGDLVFGKQLEYMNVR